ncbi:hypothetical protein [Leptolyngbya sp. FACHB-711]|uniref:hypothetical protein n=1 Tax=unclassified Leptolyngbya TaxID=2650499 RepID=UPI0016855EA1|nr:hypothetical protein [Leptolyngbya sp. FACHB-711]MBD2028225.1 hypothetical protein [Leptolyngbya sp. FACHB-711]
MTTIIFVHGTGGRKEAYAETLQQMEQALHKRRPDAKLVPCLWGDPLGAKLNAGGASIPTYKESQGGQELTLEEESVRLWENLYKDPFYEMRLLGLRPLQAQKSVPGQSTPSQELRSRVESLLTNAELQSRLNDLGIGAVFKQACEVITGINSSPFGRLLETASRPLDGDYAAIARAIISVSRILCKEQEIYPWLLVDDQLRNEAVDAIQKTLTRDEKSMGVVSTWTKSQLTGLAFGFGTNKIRRKRGAVTDGTYPFAGDILIYQAKGEKIREFIRSQIEHEQIEPPVVLLAHSLGGIACVDLLIERDLRNKVKYLITVGSQAPFFYEIGALQTLPYGEPLPEFFPKWLNIYDLRDFLSYIGDCEGLFPGKVTDVPVDNRQPFPEAHGAYWANKQTWEEIEKVLP